MSDLKASISERGKIPVASIICAVVALVLVLVIYILTEQMPAATSTESNAVNKFLVSIFGNTFLYDKKADLWLGIDIRHWAHTAEFFFLGIFATLTIWFSMKPKIMKTGGLSLAVCAVFSLIDQCHKLFVPGRHFDGFDLVMDALGYGIAILIILSIAKISTIRSKQEKS